MNDILTVREIANYLRMEDHTIYRMARKGQIPAFKASGQWRFKKDLIDRWIEEKSLENANRQLERAPE